jgi:hypothetical protein
MWLAGEDYVLPLGALSSQRRVELLDMICQFIFKLSLQLQFSNTRQVAPIFFFPTIA